MARAGIPDPAAPLFEVVLKTPQFRSSFIPTPLSANLLPWLILILAIGVILWFWGYSVRSQQREIASDFRHATEHAVEMFSSRFKFYENVVYASRGYFDSSENVTGDEWHTFVGAFHLEQNYPGLRGAFFAPFVSRNAGQAFPEQLSSSELADLSADERGFSMPITHIEPAEKRAYTLGYDLAGDALTLDAMRESCASRLTAMTGILIEPQSNRAIVRHLLPVFRQGAPLATEAQRHVALRGWVGVEFDIKAWLKSFEDEVSNREWTLRIIDAQLKSVPNGSVESTFEEARHRITHTLTLGEQPWQLEFASTPKYEQRRPPVAVHLFALSALALTLSLWLVIRRLQGGRRQALALAERMTGELRQSEARYREMFEAGKAVELLIDPDNGLIVDANQAAEDYYGYRRDELRRMSISEINVLPAEQLAVEMEQARSENQEHFLFKHRHATGEIRDVEVYAGPIVVNGKQLLYSIVHDVTARIESERALRESEARYHTVIDTTAEGYWLVDLASMKILEVNDALCRMLGYSREEMLGKQPFDFADNDNDKIFAHQASLISRLQQRSYEIELLHKDGHAVSVQIHATNMPDGDGTPVQAFAFITDITERKRIEEQLRIAATFFETTSEAITVTDMNNRIIAINPAFSHITGYSETEVLGMDPGLLSSNRHSADFYHEMWQTLQQMGRWQGEIWNRRKNGEVFPEWLSIVAIKNERGETKQYMAVFSDITKRKRDEEKIWRQANYDALTGLPNRNLFKDRLDRAIHSAHREGTMLALLFVDLDRFKWVNDTMGHASGDRLLQEAAERLIHCVRESDTVARLGGDEFTVILGDIHETGEVERVAEHILQRLAEPFELEGKEAFVSGSMGVTLYPGDAVDMEQLLRNADAAMYQAKESGRNIFRYFTSEMNEEAQRRLKLQHELRRVLDNSELLVHYQPIVHSNGEVAGAEALVRWQHPTLGFISPEEFIPLAEEIGVIVDIEQWVMRQACHDAREFQEVAGKDFFMSVNISSMQCKSEQCRWVLGSILKETDLPANTLKLEITERVMMENTEHVIALLREVKSMGVRLAVDDFGTGYSSLSYLKQFPVDVLKVDRAFIDGLPDDTDDVALVEAIVAMAHSLNLQVVAEGVETAEQLAFLRSLGCDLIQGYYFSRALSFDDFTGYLKSAAQKKH